MCVITRILCLFMLFFSPGHLYNNFFLCVLLISQAKKYESAKITDSSKN